MSSGRPPSASSGARPSRRRGRRLPLRLFLVAVALFVLVLVCVAPLFRPVSRSHRSVRVVIPPGGGVSRISAVLQSRGVIRSAWAFALYMRWSGAGRRLHAGRYVLSPDMTFGQIALELENGGGRRGDGWVRLTIPEGYTLKQIGDALSDSGIGDGKEFIRLATSPDVISRLHSDFPLPAKTLEGYLFPDTYSFPPGTPPLQVIDAMLTNFSNRFARPYQSEIGRSGRTLQAIVTAASLVEREAKAPQDRARIAGVLDNRLKRKMRLEVDATVLYALGRHKDRVVYKDLTVDSRYNTYRHRGLPPGPIANPGLAALIAALRPERNEFLYYVARPNGVHIFSRTLSEHEAARRQARLERRTWGERGMEPGG